MIKGGYILQPRIIQESDISVAAPYVREIWNFLLREANSQDVNYNGKTIKRGQLFRTYDDIREGTKWFIGWRKMKYNENQTKKAMKFLRDTQRITTQKELGGVVITVCKYDYYQNPKNYERTSERTKERTIDEPSLNQHIPDNNKNEEETNKKQKEIKNILLSQVDESTLDDKDLGYFKIAISFWELIKSSLIELNISGSEIENAKYKTWVDPIRMLIETDKRTISEFREIFNFLKTDIFWKEQIRSTSKLRKKDKDERTYFEVLLEKSRNGQRKQQQPTVNGKQSNSGVSPEYKADLLRRIYAPSGAEEM